MHQWHLISDELVEGRITETSAAGKTIAVLKKDDKVFAFAAKCPHAGAPMCEGWVDARGHVVCPLHKYRFNPANGYNSTGEGYKLMTYPVEIRDGQIYVGLLS